MTDAALVRLVRELAAEPVPADDPQYKEERAVVIGWLLKAPQMIAWGDRLPDEILRRLRLLEPLWRILTRA